MVAELEEVERVQDILESPPKAEEIARANRIKEEAFAKAKKADSPEENEVWSEFYAGEAIAKEAEEMKMNANN